MKRLFKLKKIIVLVLVLTSANIGLKASHILGAEISYKPVKGNQYKFYLKVYRDCNECKFNNNGGGSSSKNCNEVPDLQINGALNSGSTDFLGEVAMTRTAIRDVTPTCYGVASKCNVGSVINEGYEVHEFEGTFDFGTLLLQGKCQFDISIAISARNAAINSSRAEQNFFNFVSLNLCNGIPNESTRFDLTPVFSLQQNQTHSLSLGISNPDNDSLAFTLESALLNRSQSVWYSAGKSGSQPYSVYCSSGSSCPANPNALPLAEGFYISRVTGDVVFTSTVTNEGGVIVVQCEEWKKDNNGNHYLAGVTRRDIYAEVVPPSNNLPKIKNKELNISICEGEVFNYQVDLEDIKLFNINSDTVKLNVVSDLTDLKLNKTVLNIPPYNFYRLSLNNTLNKAGKYYITLNANDNNCPVNGSISKTIQLNILSKRKFDYSFKTKNCGLLQVDSKIRNSAIRWTLCDIQNRELNKQVGNGFTYQLNTGGKYILKASLDATDNLCALNLQDTITVANFQNPEIVFGQTLSVCKNTVLSVEPTLFNTYDNFKILHDNTEVTFPYTYKALTNKKLDFKVVQNNGCMAEASLNVNVFPLLNRVFTKDTICTNTSNAFDIDALIQADRNSINHIDIASANSEINLLQKDAINWDMNIVVPRAASLRFTTIITDKNNCYYLDTFGLALIEPQEINLKLPQKICANTKEVTLPANSSGIWSSDNYPGNVVGNKLSIQPPYSGHINLIYSEHLNRCINSKKYVIQIADTTVVNILHPSTMSICENTTPIQLKALPAGGKWTGNFISQNVFQPYSARNTTSKLTYTYTNSDGCKSQNSFQIEVVGLPQLLVESSKSALCVGDELKLNASTDASNLNGYWNTNGNGRFSNPNKLSTTYIPSLSDVQMGTIRINYTLQTNTICGNLTQGVDVAINEGPTGKIMPDYSLNQCEPATFTFKTNYKDLSKQYWYVNDSLVEDFDYATDLGLTLNAGNYIIKTKVLRGDCEASSISVPIIVNATPSSNFVSNPGYRLSREYPRLFLKDITGSRNPYSTQWYFNGQPIEQSREFYYNIPESGRDTFTIKLVNMSSVGGCSDSIEKLFVFNPLNQLYIPDAFSPDAKGPDENNEFKVKGPAMLHFYMEVFNKWGEIVYFSKDMNMAWDGNFGGKMAPQGVYFYKINSTDLTGVSRDYSGTITLIR